MHVGFTVPSPGGGEETASRNSDRARVARSWIPVPAVAYKGHPDNVSHSPGKGLLCHPVVAELLSSYRSPCSFHGIAAIRSGDAQGIVLTEPVPRDWSPRLL